MNWVKTFFWMTVLTVILVLVGSLFRPGGLYIALGLALLALCAWGTKSAYLLVGIPLLAGFARHIARPVAGGQPDAAPARCGRLFRRDPGSKGDGQRGGAEAVVALLLALRQQSAQREISAECVQTSKEQKAYDCLSQKSQVRR